MGFKNEKEMEDFWNNLARKMLVGRKITTVEYMDRKTADAIGFRSRPVIIRLDSGLLIYPSADDEGNDGGALFTSDEEQPTLPVL